MRRKISNKNYPSIGIIIPVYNGEYTIIRCIKSILKQTYRNFYIYIINDGSTDDTRIKLNEFSNNPRICIINQNNKGVSVARNRGIDEANTDYIAFIDSDDYVEKDYLKNLISEYLDNKVDLAIEGYKTLKNNVLTNIYYPVVGIFTVTDTVNMVLRNDGPKGFLWNKLWKKKIIDDNKLYFQENVKMAEDLLFTIEYILKCKKIIVENKNNYIYNLNSYGLSSSIEFDNNMNFDKTFSDYLSTLKEIQKLLNKNGYQLNKINSKFGIVASRYLRLINITDTYTNPERVENKLKKVCSRYIKYVLKDKEISYKTKIAYILSLYLPNVMSRIDKNIMEFSDE